jgi:hypothetical protein
MSAAVAESRAHFGKEAWGLVNCAGVMHYQYISDLDVESWAQASVIFYFLFFIFYIFSSQSTVAMCGKRT